MVWIPNAQWEKALKNFEQSLPKVSVANSAATHAFGSMIDIDALTPEQVYILKYALGISGILGISKLDWEPKESGPGAVIDALGLPVLRQRVRYPCSCINLSDYDDLADVIVHPNDVDKWSREQIADWLDELHDSGVVNIIVEEKK